MRRKIVIGIMVLFILCGVVFAYMYFYPKDYVVPYTLTKLYGEDLEELFSIGKADDDGVVLWKDCQRDKDKNIVVTMTEMQRIHVVRKLENIFSGWEWDIEYEGGAAIYNIDYTEIDFSGGRNTISNCLSEEDIHFMMIGFYAYQIFRGEEDNKVTVTVEDEEGNICLEKHFTNFPEDVELYELPASKESYKEVIENTGSYEAINVDYEGNIEIIATPEQFERLPQEVKDACK